MPKKIAIILTAGYADWECAFINGIGSAYFGFETVNVSPDGQEIVSQGGLRTIPDDSMAHIKPNDFDMLILCGSAIWETAEAPDVKKLALNFLKENKHVAAICGGTLALADAGILDNRRHTSNALEFLTGKSETYNGSSYYVEGAAAISDDNVITAAGSSPIQFSAAVFRAVGVEEKTISEFLAMLASEHSKDIQT
jgi:putative intracellular protease/amidase